MSQNSHHQRHPQAKAIAIAQAQEQQAQNQMALGLTALAGFLAVAFTAVSLHQAQVKALLLVAAACADQRFGS
ncbi:MAG: hypothetical protein LRY39_00595 [Alphaproteobacteria bacterium]|nr:hypothetical protein [Alphaproteobacteria bacterium]